MDTTGAAKREPNAEESGMDWSEQTDQLMKTWTESQKQLWGGWMNWAQTAGGVGTPAMFDPSKLLRTGADTWSGAQETPAQRLAGNIFGTPDMMSLAMNLIMKAWQAASPNIEGGKDWRPDIKKLLEQWREQATSPTLGAGMPNEFARLTKSMFEQWSPLTAPWLSMLGQSTAAGHPGEAFLSGTAGLGQIAGFSEAFQLMRGYGEFGLSEMPRVTIAREKMGKFLRVADTVSDLRKAQAEYHKKLAEGIATSVERTVDHLAKLAEKGEKVTSARELMRTFFTITDKTLLEIFTTQEFLDIQNRLTLALMNHKIAQREALEIIYNSLEIPTRSEVDEAYKDIHALKREVRALRKALKEASAGKLPASRGGGKKAAAADTETAEPAAT
jgi:class III poly(R)-hydroxyalkanoic acid synthase PhaE subunit